MANKFVGGSVIDTRAPSSYQVHQQLDSGNLYLDSLEQIVRTLVSRLADISTSNTMGEAGEEPAPVLVPIASRISYYNSRVRSVEQQLQAAVDALEI